MIIEVLTVSVLAFLINIPLGLWRKRYKKLSLPWWLIVHASIPILVSIRLWLDTPRLFIPLFILLAVIGQLAGARLTRRNIDPCE